MPELCSKSDQDLFTYTSGRYLYNEKLRRAERCVPFDVAALKDIAARCVGRQSVARLEKLAEGGFSRVFLLTMNDGFEVIAKLPYSLTVPKHFTTESEVATLDFLSSKTVPVPRVYAWSSEGDNPVGSEYIIMEKAPGQPLQSRWFSLTKKERVHLVTSFVEIERKIFSFALGSYGSLYYRGRLPSHLEADLYTPETVDESGDGSRFCLGPATDYMFWRGKRAQLDLNRGPWSDPHDYLRSVGQRELEWTRRFGKAQVNDFPHNTVLKGEISPKTYLDLLDKYLSVAPHLLPRDHGNPLNRPTLRHPDLNPTNLFVSESCEVSCIIDWQHTTALPLLLMAGHPPLFENPDPGPPKGFEKPSLPEDYDSLSQEEKMQADELHRQRMLSYLYMVFNAKDNKAHFNALRYLMLMPCQHLVDRVGRQWSGNPITLKGALLRIVNNWNQLAQGESCPVHFDANDEEEFLQTEDRWFTATMLLEHWRSVLDDVGQDGWVRNESYERVVEVNRRLKRQWLDEAEDDEDLACVEKYWPFQDHEEFD
ncbi:MAG: Phosphotransferase enzyme [Caeruleum heppii]|nr:MAG: Phosphotransferase enzyme [Caeruleum heppii]